MLNLVEKFTPAVEADTDDAGLTTVEYAVAAAVVTAGAVGIFLTLGNKVAGEVQDLINRIN
jgi:Flp pilus assembly pilin Flp